MKTTFSILLIALSLGVAQAQTTAIPDANFEQALIDLGYDTGVPDGVVLTDSINTVTSLHIENQSISDLTGIEDFTALWQLFCQGNSLVNLNLSQNSNLVILT